MKAAMGTRNFLEAFTSALMKELSVTSELTERSIILATGRNSSVFGLLKNVPITFRTSVPSLYFFFISG